MLEHPRRSKSNHATTTLVTTCQAETASSTSPEDYRKSHKLQSRGANMARSGQVQKAASVPITPSAPPKVAHTLSAPSFHPPYEAHIDLRIPLHFSGQIHNYRYVDAEGESCPRATDLDHRVVKFGQTQGMNLNMELCRALSYHGGSSDPPPPDDSPFWSPFFWGVNLGPENVGRMRGIHETLRTMFMQAYSDCSEFATDPPIRYFVLEPLEDWGDGTLFD